MKLTERKLKEIILEELQKTQVIVPADQADEAESVLYREKIATYEIYPSAGGQFQVFVVMGGDEEAQRAVNELRAAGIDAEY